MIGHPDRLRGGEAAIVSQTTQAEARVTMLGCSPLPRARATRGARVTCEVPWKSGALAPRQSACDMGFSPSAHPEATTGARAHLHSMRNAALKGPLFHVGVNSRDMFLGLVSVAPSGLCLPDNTNHG